VKIQKIIKKYALESGEIKDDSLKVNILLTNDLSKVSPYFQNEVPAQTQPKSSIEIDSSIVICAKDIVLQPFKPISDHLDEHNIQHSS
jgi:hypothetical protein